MIKTVEIFKTINWLESMKIENYSINPDLTVDVDGNVDLGEKGLTKIPVQFGIVRGWFWCNDNQLTSLEGAPREVVRGAFYCDNNQLTTLEGAPEIVRGAFFCNNNQLTSLEGAPKIVEGYFDCSDNQLTSLQGAPKIVRGSFGCKNNKKKFTKEYIRTVCKVDVWYYI